MLPTNNSTTAGRFPKWPEWTQGIPGQKRCDVTLHTITLRGSEFYRAKFAGTDPAVPPNCQIFLPTTLREPADLVYQLWVG
jgi:hypothetical protein